MSDDMLDMGADELKQYFAGCRDAFTRVIGIIDDRLERLRLIKASSTAFLTEGYKAIASVSDAIPDLQGDENGVLLKRYTEGCQKAFSGALLAIHDTMDEFADYDARLKLEGKPAPNVGDAARYLTTLRARIKRRMNVPAFSATDDNLG